MTKKQIAVFTVSVCLISPAAAESWLSAKVAAFLARARARSAGETSVAAVRGANPDSKQESMADRLSESASLLRQRELSEAETQTLRKIYRALAVSRLASACDSDPAVSYRYSLAARFRQWKPELEKDGVPAEIMKILLAGKPGEKILSAAGWRDYAVSITPEQETQNSGSAPKPKPETARLDEMLSELGKSRNERALSPAELAELLVLEGFACEELSRADYSGSTEAAAVPAASASAGAPKITSSPDEAAPRDFEPGAIYKKASPSVAVVICGSESGTGELGSASVIDSAGYFLTNAHVVIQESTGKPYRTVSVYLKPAKITGDRKKDLSGPLSAKVVSWDSDLDLALLKTNRVSAPPLSFGDSGTVSIGDRVAAIGHPEQGGFWTLTTGVVSTLVADIGGVKGKDVFQTDASINRGNSGGPLLDSAGRIIGVNTLMSRRSADGLAITAVNFAVRSDIALAWLEKAGFSASARPVEQTPQVAAAAPKPSEPAPAIQSVPSVQPAAQTVSTPVVSVRPIRKPAARPQRETITESRPYSREQVLAEQIRQMEDLEREMQSETENVLREQKP